MQRSNLNLALGLHRIDRVVDQVRPHLIQLGAIGLNHR
jgi:hypothetical protein